VILLGSAGVLGLLAEGSASAGAEVPLPPVKVTWHSEPCPDPTALACAQGTDVWFPTDGGRRLRFHELGHVFDFTAMDEQARSQWLAVFGDTREWFGKYSDPPYERFAESYATCKYHKRLRKRYTSALYDYAVTPGQHRRVCSIIRQAYARAVARSGLGGQ
jgi:hypothetical protein